MFRKTFEEQLENMYTVLDRLDKANMKLKAKKCHFFCKEMSFLGHIVSEDGVKTDH